MEHNGNMKLYRKKKKLRLKDLAVAVGTTEATLSRYETGQRRMPIEMAKKIAPVLNVAWWRLYE